MFRVISSIRPDNYQTAVYFGSNPNGASLVKKIILVILLIAAGVCFFIFRQKQLVYEPPESQIDPEDLFKGISYEGVTNRYAVNLISDKLVSPTRILITADNRHLLVSQITGEVMAFDRRGDSWNDVPNLVTQVETKFPGFPPDEAGLAGIVLSSNFTQNGKLFLLYTYKDKDGSTQNRISVSQIKEKSGKLVGTKPKLIYQANIAGSASHQITDGIGLTLENEPHIMFLIGDGFHGDRAQDPKLEAGKVIIIREDGSNPLGIRPFENPKIEALGIRNAFVIASIPNNPEEYLIGDTGPDKYDRLIYAQLPSGTKLNFNWSGDQEKLKEPIPDPYNPHIKDLVIHRQLQTQTFTGLKFFPNSNDVLAVMFGKSGSPENSPGKEIWLGKLTNLSDQPQITFNPIVRRAKATEGKLGNPIGLEIDPLTNDFFFADILEGRLYQVKGGDNHE